MIIRVISDVFRSPIGLTILSVTCSAIEATQLIEPVKPGAKLMDECWPGGG